ncbi:MAG TPA: GNAT family protein [Gemmatimonadales bacterium]
MQPLPVSSAAELRPLELADAPALLAAITAHREELDPWLRWSRAIQTPADAAAFIAQFTAKLTRGEGFHLGLRADQRLLGGVICWSINRDHRNAEVGYWLIPDARGQGLATAATRAVVQHLFQVERLHRVELQCAVTNDPSRRLAERLGFQFEGVRRESHWLSTRFVDHAVYGALATDWDTT